MNNLHQQWDEFGHVVFAFLEVIAIPWNAKDLYEDVEDVYFNALVAYYLIQIIMMQNDERYGSPYAHFLPGRSIENTLGNLANFFARCRYWDPSVPFKWWNTREYAIEPFLATASKGGESVG